MSNQIVEFMKKNINNEVVDSLSGTLTFENDKCILEPRGGVYGIAIKLSTEEVEDFFNKYNEKKSVTFESWKSIGDNFYPLYWGKDSNLGFRLFDHTKCRDTTATIQLNKRDYLKDYTVIYGAIFCKNPSASENSLRTSNPDIFITHKGFYDFNKK